MSLVYIGCGTDFDLLSKFNQIKEFIYIDCQPKSSYGYLEFDTGIFYSKNYMKKLSRFTTFARNHLRTYLGQFSPQFLCLQGLLNIS